MAKAYDAACTPDFYIFDVLLKLVYRGQLDDSRPGNNIPLSGKDIRLALDNIWIGREVPPMQRPSIGCNIKWKKWSKTIVIPNLIRNLIVHILKTT